MEGWDVSDALNKENFGKTKERKNLIAKFNGSLKFAILFRMRKTQARVAQLVEHNLAKVGVASSNLVSRSNC